MTTPTRPRPQPRRARNVDRAGVASAARLAYGARAAMYTGLGLLSLMLAFLGGRARGSQGVLEALARNPLGAALLGIVGLCLLAFAAWRFVQALMDLEGAGSSAKGMLARGALVLSGLIHTFLGALCFRILAGREGTGATGVQSLGERLLAQPVGQVLAAIVGAGVVVFALHQLWRAWTGRAVDMLQVSGPAAKKRTEVERLCRAGVAARALVLVPLGAFLLSAALRARRGEASGPVETLATLAQQPFGRWLFAAASLGLLAFAAAQLVTARFRRVVAA
ncbi:MAG: DUF1206 domain-containing protein [Myxococcaceae bacterium]|nr:DUF1206 domain-containing protein [Myxococcaceae bacterium]MCI0672455.1 DUF1206 domain-containing protein [Myxococcaceae bacterium]